MYLNSHVLEIEVISSKSTVQLLISRMVVSHIWIAPVAHQFSSPGRAELSGAILRMEVKGSRQECRPGSSAFISEVFSRVIFATARVEGTVLTLNISSELVAIMRRSAAV